MLLLGVFAAIVLIIATRKSDVIVHDPADGLPKAGGNTPFHGVLGAMKDLAKQVELQALEQQRREEQRRQEEPRPHVSGPSGRPPLRDPRADLEEVRALLRAGQPIDAIRLYRMKFRVGLKEARAAVDKLAAGG